LNATHIELSKYAINNDLVIEHDYDRATNIIDLERMKKNISELISAHDGWVILDGHYAHEIISTDQIFRIIILRRAPWVLKEELAIRGYSKSKVWENVEAELLSVCSSESRQLHPKEIVCEIDTTKKEPLKTLEEVLQILNDDEKCLDTPIDWMQYHRAEILLRERTYCT